MTDDGTVNVPSKDEDDAEPEVCDCDGLNDFQCWPCVQTGRKELPERNRRTNHYFFFSSTDADGSD